MKKILIAMAILFLGAGNSFAGDIFLKPSDLPDYTNWTLTSVCPYMPGSFKDDVVFGTVITYVNGKTHEMVKEIYYGLRSIGGLPDVISFVAPRTAKEKEDRDRTYLITKTGFKKGKSIKHRDVKIYNGTLVHFTVSLFSGHMGKGKELSSKEFQFYTTVKEIEKISL